MIAPTRAFLRLELLEASRSRWLAFTAAVYALVFGGFVWLGLRESAVLGFTGLSRVVLNMTNAIAIAVPLVALVATSQSFVRARQSGFMELMLAQPVRRTDWFWSITSSRFVVVLGPLVLLLVGTCIAAPFVGETDQALVPMVLRSLATTTALATAFIGLGLWVSSVARSPERATVLALLAWLVATALHDFALVGTLLRFKIPPQLVFALAACNPSEAARLAILSSVDADLSILGPVGFWISNTLGPTRVLAVGLAWPAALGAFGLWRARRRLLMADLVD